MVKQIIKEAMEQNPIGLKEAVEAELMSRLQLALEAKKKSYKEEDDYEEDEAEEDDEDDEDEMDEEASPKWKVKIGNKTYVVTAKNTFEANKKAEAKAKKEGNSGVSTGKIEKV
jgi:hypothetical protein